MVGNVEDVRMIGVGVCFLNVWANASSLLGPRSVLFLLGKSKYIFFWASWFLCGIEFFLICGNYLIISEPIFKPLNRLEKGAEEELMTQDFFGDANNRPASAATPWAAEVNQNN